MDYDRLDTIASQAAQGDDSAVGVLSTGERLYVALAANRCDLLGNDSIAYAISRMEDEDLRELVERHRGDIPAKPEEVYVDSHNLLRKGGAWLGAARNYLNRVPGGERLEHGSDQKITLTAKQIEELTAKAVAAALNERSM